MLKEKEYANYLSSRDRYFEDKVIADSPPNFAFWEKLKACFWCTFQRLPFLEAKLRATFWWSFGAFLAGMIIYVTSTLIPAGNGGLWIGLASIVLVLPGYLWSGIAKSSRPGNTVTFRTIFWIGITLRWLLTPATVTTGVVFSIFSAILFAGLGGSLWYLLSLSTITNEYKNCRTEKESLSSTPLS